MTTLNKLSIGSTATINSLLFTGNLRRRMLDLGIVPNSKITALFKSPFGNPTAFLIRGSIIALRNIDAEKIIIK